jgi:hypothetical protein
MEKLLDVGECLEVGLDGSCSMLGFIEGKIVEEISVVGKGTSGSAFFYRM